MKFSRALLATGTIPKVTVQYHVHTADGSSDGAHEDTYIAVAIDEELGNCEYSLCKPSWLVPWGRADGSQVMQIQISTEGLGMLWQIKSKTLQVGNHDTKTELTALASFEVGLLGNLSNVAAELDSGWMHETQNMQGQSLVLLTILDGVAMASVCDDTMGIPASRVTGAASLYNKLILKTNAGLFELKADFQRDGSKFITQFPAANILSKCIAELVISPQSLSVDKIVLAIGAPPHSGEVYFVKANNATGQHYDFQPLEDSRARKVCDAVSGMYDTCSVVSGSVSAVKPSAIVLLVKVNDTYKTVEFFTLMEARLFQCWMVTMEIPTLSF
ncbi:PREDICTED: uncharacterized protein LOC106820931 [Priapulus caudatus]|uniref:Uncharacterized protein LOC106820931 n=1 Tax=Priapulus caudatus TaxID=37621 RepID=A0ABM1F999_PRICU|nr:PREDICTED: uncharacterized protein LOC106820931 [Priapulus caudatus]